MIERDAEVTCDSEDVVILTVSRLALGYLEAAKRAERPSTYLVLAIDDVESVAVERCDWSGIVTVSVGNEFEQWLCPMCRTLHETEIDV